MIKDHNWQYRGDWWKLHKEKRFEWKELEKHFSPPKQGGGDKIPRKLKKKIKGLIREDHWKDITPSLAISWYRELVNPDHDAYLLKLFCRYTRDENGKYVKIPPVKSTKEIKEKIHKYFPEKEVFNLFDETGNYFKEGVEWSDDGTTMALKIPGDGKTFKKYTKCAEGVLLKFGSDEKFYPNKK